MQTPNANVVEDFATRLRKMRDSLDMLSEEILTTYPTADDIVDSIDLAVSDLDDALSAFADFDPDADEDEDEPETDEEA